MTTAWSQSYRLTVVLILVIGLLAGCASVFRDLDDRVNRKRFKSDYASFENALSVYKDGDYKQAMNLFRTLSTARTHAKLARKAQLGDICCRLMLANTKSEHAAAISLWRDFGKSVPDGDDAWEMTMLDPLVVHLTPKSTIRVIEIRPPEAPTPVESEAPADRPQDDPPNGPPTRTDRAALKKNAAQAAQLQRQLDAVTAENRSLKEKIKALEAIDQNIQKKKTEMVAPSE
jgi:hypothetical protein